MCMESEFSTRKGEHLYKCENDIKIDLINILVANLESNS